jgi:hypothetical protein
MKPMTMRERMLAVVQGREHDRVPFVQYDGMVPAAEVWADVGRENIGLLRWVGAIRLDSPHCRFDREDIRDGKTKVEWKTCSSRVFQCRYVLGETLMKDPKVDPIDGRVALMRVVFACPGERDCFLEVAGPVWQTFLNEADLGVQRSGARQRVHLKAGTNVLFLRVFETKPGEGAYAIAFQFADIDGVPFDDLTVVK